MKTLREEPGFSNFKFPQRIKVNSLLDMSLFGRKKMVVPGYCDSNLHRLFPGSYFLSLFQLDSPGLMYKSSKVLEEFWNKLIILCN